MASTASAIIRIHPADDVVIARHQLVGGTLLTGEGVTVSILDAGFPGVNSALSFQPIFEQGRIR